MFGGRFSFTRFSLSSKIELEIKIQAFFIENTHNLISFSANILAENNFRENIRIVLTATQGINAENKLIENVKANLNARINYMIVDEYKEEVSSNVYIASDLRITDRFKESGDSRIYLGKNTPVSNDFMENLRNHIILGKNINSIHDFREEIFSRVYPAILDNDIFTINASIPPGGELRIDSENYTVTLNGENIIHLFDGDWINLTRELIDISIATGNADMSGTLIYLEKFL